MREEIYDADMVARALHEELVREEELSIKLKSARASLVLAQAEMDSHTHKVARLRLILESATQPSARSVTQ